MDIKQALQDNCKATHRLCVTKIGGLGIMGAFELQDTETLRSGGCLDNRKVREERIIAFKVYDSCRAQNCLTPAEIGPSRAVEPFCIGEENHKEGDIIRPPDNAASATIEHLKIKRIIVVSKQPSPFKNGYWDVDIKFVFEYLITFREADACVICSVKANNSYSMRVTLFGSMGSDLVIGTDLLRAFGDSATFDAEPFVLVEAKAVSLNASIHYPHHHGKHECKDREEVHVTIGLFSIVKLFRLVNLSVESRGFDIPDECRPSPTPVNPCAFFEKMEFPMDIFAPPQKKEFSSGISHNIHKD